MSPLFSLSSEMSRHICRLNKNVTTSLSAAVEIYKQSVITIESSWRSGPTGSGAKWVLVRALHQAAKLGPCRGGGLGCRERELIMVSSSGNVSGNECGSAGELINLRGGCALWTTRTIRILRAVARQRDKTSPEECATGLRGPGERVRVNMLEIASAVLFENFNCIVELSHECFSLSENDTWAWNAVFLSWRGFWLFMSLNMSKEYD